MIGGSNKNAKAIATSMDGMGHFKPLVTFEQETVAAVMANLLVHDLRNTEAAAHPATAAEHASDFMQQQAFHGGSYRTGLKPDSLGTLQYMLGSIARADPRPGQEGSSRLC